MLIGSEQRRRLEREASSRGTSVATLVREAIDLAFPPDRDQRADAARRILAAEPIEVPDVDKLLREIDELRSRRA